MRTDRAISVAVTHAMTVAVTAVLISTLLVGAGQLLDRQENRAARDQLSEIGSDVVAQINSLDRLNATGENVTVTVQPTYPDRVVGEEYTINITDDESSFRFEAEHALEVRSDLLDRPIRYPLRTDTRLDETADTQGGEVTICLDGGRISLGRNCA